MHAIMFSAWLARHVNEINHFTGYMLLSNKNKNDYIKIRFGHTTISPGKTSDRLPSVKFPPNLTWLKGGRR